MKKYINTEPKQIEILLKGSFFQEPSLYNTSDNVRGLSIEDYYPTLGVRLVRREHKS